MPLILTFIYLFFYLATFPYDSSSFRRIFWFLRLFSFLSLIFNVTFLSFSSSIVSNFYHVYSFIYIPVDFVNSFSNMNMNTKVLNYSFLVQENILEISRQIKLALNLYILNEKIIIYKVRSRLFWACLSSHALHVVEKYHANLL